MGSGYDILKGNPDNEDSFDPGFRSRIFQYTYEEQQTTEDGKYLVPDDIDSRLTQTCSLSATTSTFYGTKSYQKSLQTKVDVAGGYDGSLTQAAFSASLSYEHVKESTIEQENIMSHA